MYILKISNKAFIRKSPELIIVEDYRNSTIYKTIGEAMRQAANLNTLFGNTIVKIEFLGRL